MFVLRRWCFEFGLACVEPSEVDLFEECSRVTAIYLLGVQKAQHTVFVRLHTPFGRRQSSAKPFPHATPMFLPRGCTKVRSVPCFRLFCSVASGVSRPPPALPVSLSFCGIQTNDARAGDNGSTTPLTPLFFLSLPRHLPLVMFLCGLVWHIFEATAAHVTGNHRARHCPCGSLPREVLAEGHLFHNVLVHPIVRH